MMSCLSRYQLLVIVIGLLLLLGPVASQSPPTSAPTLLRYGSNYCNEFSGNSNSSSADYQVSCVGCLQAGCAYCLVDIDNVMRNYCYSYSNLNDPTYGTCGDRQKIEVDENERGKDLSEDEYESYCQGYDLGTLIVIILFFYFLFPCFCAAVMVTIIMKIYRSTCAPDQRVHPLDEQGRPIRDQHVLMRREQYYPQHQDPLDQSPYGHLQMADAKVLTPRGAAGSGGTYAQPQGHDEEVHEIPVVYAEAVPAIQHG